MATVQYHVTFAEARLGMLLESGAEGDAVVVLTLTLTLTPTLT